MSSPTAVTASAGTAPPRSALVLTSLILGAVAANMNLGIANVALPTIGRDLGASQAQLTSVANAFTLGLACSVLYFGALGDRYGRKLMFKLGALFSIPTAVLSAYAPSTEVLIGGRFLAGLAAGMLFPTTLSILSALYTGKKQTKAIALWSGIGGGFAALGPLLGGLLLDRFWWGSVFLITVPIVVAALALGWVVLPEAAGEDAQTVDNIGGVLSVIAVATLVVALQSVAGFNWIQVIVLALISAATFTLFLRRQSRVERPLVDLQAASATTFWVAAVAGTVTFGALMGTLFIGQQFTQNVLRFSALEGAMYQLPVAIFMIVMAVPAARLLVRFGGRITFALGLLLLSFAFVWILIFWRPGAAGFHVLFAYTFVGIGVGIAVTPASKALMASLPASRAGMGSAFTDLTRDFGGSVMNAIMGTALAVAYGASITRALNALSPAQSEALGTQAAGEIVASYEGAEAVAAGYPPNVAQQIISQAAESFSEGKEVAVALALAFALTSIALVLWKYPRKPEEFAFFEQIEAQNRAAAAAEAGVAAGAGSGVAGAAGSGVAGAGGSGVASAASAGGSGEASAGGSGQAGAEGAGGAGGVRGHVGGTPSAGSGGAQSSGGDGRSGSRGSADDSGRSGRAGS